MSTARLFSMDLTMSEANSALAGAYADPDFDVAIVGGGFAGTMVAVQLAAASAVAPRIVMFDSAGAFAKGAAYSAASEHCLLNVRAKAMGAFHDDEGHFLRWLREQGYRDEDADLANQFLPRNLYGAYLLDLLAGCREAGMLTERKARVIDIQRNDNGYVLIDSAGGSVSARSVVLALGNIPASFGDSSLGEAMLSHARPAWKILASDYVERDASMLIVGTGLTALDVMLHLTAHGHRGRIDMLSRHGRFPLPHAAPGKAAVLPAALEGAPQDVLRELRRLVREFEAQGHTWHDVIDAVRPYTSGIWQRWTPAERRQFIRHIAPLWEVHRHRAPTSTLAVRDELIASGRLTVHAGRLFALEATSDGLQARYVDRHRGRASELHVASVIDCTGTQKDYRRSGEPLIDALLARGLATTDPLGLGFAAEPNGALIGRNGHTEGVFVLGTPLRGALYECGSVREVRAQAATVARELAAKAGKSREHSRV
jgi:uncharacterized NAD(P)/FAD-binding protein YdhS